jgi:hypothetical protein
MGKTEGHAVRQFPQGRIQTALLYLQAPLTQPRKTTMVHDPEMRRGIRSAWEGFEASKQIAEGRAR